MGKKKFLVLLILILPAFFGFINGLESQQQQVQPDRQEVEVRLILVDVLVTRDGKFVTDLTQDDFELYEDGKRVPINSFELVSFEETKLISPEEKPEAEISQDTPKKQLVVIFDGVCSWQRNLKEGGRKVVDQLCQYPQYFHLCSGS